MEDWDRDSFFKTHMTCILHARHASFIAWGGCLGEWADRQTHTGSDKSLPATAIPWPCMACHGWLAENMPWAHRLSDRQWTGSPDPQSPLILWEGS